MFGGCSVDLGVDNRARGNALMPGGDQNIGTFLKLVMARAFSLRGDLFLVSKTKKGIGRGESPRTPFVKVAQKIRHCRHKLSIAQTSGGVRGARGSLRDPIPRARFARPKTQS